MKDQPLRIRTALGEMILKHWQAHRPQMVKELRKCRRLDQAVFEAQSQTEDVMYDMVCLKAMDYQTAWEIATEGWALPGQTTEVRSRKPDSSKRRRSPSLRSRSRNRQPRPAISE